MEKGICISRTFRTAPTLVGVILYELFIDLFSRIVRNVMVRRENGNVEEQRESIRISKTMVIAVAPDESSFF